MSKQIDKKQSKVLDKKQSKEISAQFDILLNSEKSGQERNIAFNEILEGLAEIDQDPEVARKAIARMFVNYKRDPDNGNTIFHRAVIGRDIVLIRLLADLGSDDIWTSKNNAGQTGMDIFVEQLNSDPQAYDPIMFVIRQNFIKNDQLELFKRIFNFIPDRTPQELLEDTAEYGSSKIAKWLIAEKGAVIDSSFLYNAFAYDQLEYIESLNVDDFNSIFLHGDPLLNICINHISVEGVKFLIESGLRLDARGTDGETALIRAARNYAISIILSREDKARLLEIIQLIIDTAGIEAIIINYSEDLSLLYNEFNEMNTNRNGEVLRILLAAPGVVNYIEDLFTSPLADHEEKIKAAITTLASSVNSELLFSPTDWEQCVCDQLIPVLLLGGAELNKLLGLSIVTENFKHVKALVAANHGVDIYGPGIGARRLSELSSISVDPQIREYFNKIEEYEQQINTLLDRRNHLTVDDIFRQIQILKEESDKTLGLDNPQFLSALRSSKLNLESAIGGLDLERVQLTLMVQEKYFPGSLHLDEILGQVEGMREDINWDIGSVKKAEEKKSADDQKAAEEHRERRIDEVIKKFNDEIEEREEGEEGEELSSNAEILKGVMTGHDYDKRLRHMAEIIVDEKDRKDALAIDEKKEESDQKEEKKERSDEKKEKSEKSQLSKINEIGEWITKRYIVISSTSLDSLAQVLAVDLRGATPAEKLTHDQNKAKRLKEHQGTEQDWQEQEEEQEAAVALAKEIGQAFRVALEADQEEREDKEEKDGKEGKREVTEEREATKPSTAPKATKEESKELKKSESKAR